MERLSLSTWDWVITEYVTGPWAGLCAGLQVDLWAGLGDTVVKGRRDF